MLILLRKEAATRMCLRVYLGGLLSGRARCHRGGRRGGGGRCVRGCDGVLDDK